MAKLLLKAAEVLVAGDPQGNEFYNGWLVVDEGRIESLGEGVPPAGDYDRVVNCEGHVVMPGLVNTHHHLYQSLFRCVPKAQDMELFDWLRFLYQRWRHIDEQAVFDSTVTGLVELLLSGCTTTTDHLYLYPSGHDRLQDVQIEAARAVGMRFHPCRGSMSFSTKDGGLPPPDVVQTEEEILLDSERLLEGYHDPSPSSMLRVALAPCSPFSVSPELMIRSAELARRYGALLHTHLAETIDEERFCLEKFQCRPVELLERVGWLADDVWVAHLVYPSDAELSTLNAHGVGVAHCPASNMITGAGIAPVSKMLRLGMRVGLAVDGSAANDMGNLLREARLAMLLARLSGGASAISGREALAMATMGGARAMRWEDSIGSLEPGKRADVAVYDVSGVACAGAHDLVTALVRCDITRAAYVMVDGWLLVEEGACVDGRLARHIAHHRVTAEGLRNCC